MRWRSILTLGIVVSFAAGCAATHSAIPVTDPDVITTDQIAKSKATNAYDVIATISPKMFIAHGAATIMTTDLSHAYIDENRRTS